MSARRRTCAVFLASLAAPAAAQFEESGGCCLWTFAGDQAVIPPGTCAGVTTDFTLSFQAITDADAGGVGNFANEPSPDAVAHVPTGGYGPPAGPFWINFSPPVSYVSLHYSSFSLPAMFEITAWDGPSATGNLIDVELGTVSGWLSFCEGDPTGLFCDWGQVRVDAPTSVIQSIAIENFFSDFVIDNVLVCENAPACPTAASVTDVGGPGLASHLRPYPPNTRPTLGNTGFGQVAGTPAACLSGSASGFTFRAVSATTGSLSVPGAACAVGSAADLLIGFPPLDVSGPVTWTGPGDFSVHVLPLPFDTALCGLTVYTQGLVVLANPVPYRYLLTNREDLVLGL